MIGTDEYCTPCTMILLVPFAVNVIGTILVRREEQMYIALWYIIATVEFVADSSRQLWDKIKETMDANPKLKLGITPSLDLRGRALPLTAVLHQAAVQAHRLQHHRHVQQSDDPDLVLSAPFPVTPASLDWCA